MNENKTVMMPVDLTQEMIAADPYGLGYGRLQAIWKALIAARPTEQADEITALRQEQAQQVMPLIGPLLDAYEGTQKGDLADISPELVRLLRAINQSMIAAAPAPAATADASLCLAQQGEREAFDKWHIKFGKGFVVYSMFNSHEQGIAWKAWQARAALTASSEATAPQDAQERDRIVESIVSDVCEMDPADQNLNDTICIDVSDLITIVKRHVDALTTAQPADQRDKPELICKSCAADRAKEDCKGDRANCSLRGTAYVAEGKAEQQAEPHVCKFERAIDLKTLDGWYECTCGKKQKAGYPYYPPEQPQEPIKDHVIAQTVNQLRDIALEFHATQQLRARIAEVIVPLLSRQSGKGTE